MTAFIRFGPLVCAFVLTVATQGAGGGEPNQIRPPVIGSATDGSLLRWYGEHDCLGLPGEDVVVSINQLDLHLVLAGREPGYVDCVVVTRIRPQPGQVVDGYVQVPDTWRCLEGTLPEHG